MKSQEIKTELDGERVQLAKTQTLLATAERELATAQAAFAGSKITLEELVAAQATQMALSGAAHRLALNIATLTSELATAQAAETRAAGIAELTEISEQANATLEGYTQALQAGFAAIELAGRRMVAAKVAHSAERDRFSASLRRLVPNADTAALIQFGRPDAQAAVDALNKVRAELNGVDLTGIAAHLNGHEIPVFNRDGCQFPQSYFQSELDEASRKILQLDANRQAQPAPTDDNSDHFPEPEPAGSGAYQVGVSQTVRVLQ